MSYFPLMARNCTFGYWGVWGRILDLKTHVAVLTGLLTGVFFLSWFLLSILITTYKRYAMYLEAKDAVRRRYGAGLPAGQRPLPADCKFEAVNGIFIRSNPNIRIFDPKYSNRRTIHLHRFVESNPCLVLRIFGHSTNQDSD